VTGLDLGGLDLSSDVELVQGLAMLARDIAKTAGFGVVVFSLRSSEAELTTVVSVGDDRARDSLLGTRLPIDVVDALLAASQAWGILHFVRDTSVVAGTKEPWLWTDPDHTTQPMTDWWDEEHWESENALVAPLVGEHGEVLGLLSVDLPADGLQPSEAQRLALSTGARQAERSLAAAALRTIESHRLSLMQAARLVVREAGMEHHVSELLPRARAALIANFELHDAWIKCSPADMYNCGPQHFAGGDPAPLMAPPAGSASALTPSLLAGLSSAAQRCWNDQAAVELSARTRAVPGMSPRDTADLLAFLSARGVKSALIVPLGSGGTRLGSMTLGRGEQGRPWTEAEKSVALDIGHDLGRALVHTLWFEERERAEAASQAKSMFLANISHEIRTPLTAVLGASRLLRTGPLDERQLRLLDMMDQSGGQLLTLVESILDFSRMEAGRPALVTAAFDLRAALETVTHAQGPRAVARGLHYHLSVDPQLPHMVMGDRARIMQVLTNLVSNAIKFTERGGVTLTASRADSADQAMVRFSVTDTGIGITAADQKSIFGSFTQVDPSGTRRYNGVGLGLAICKELVSAMNGSIAVTSEPGCGTTFLMTLPLLRP